MSRPGGEGQEQGGFRKRTVDSWQVFGGVAGVLGLLGTWIGIVRDELTLPLATGVVLALIGAFLLYRWGGGDRRGSPTGFAVPLLVTVLGAATAGAAWAAKSTGDTTTAGATTAPSSSSSTAAAPVSGASTTTTGPPTPAGGAAVAAEVRLDRGTGVDLDAGQTKGVETEGPNGAIDHAHTRCEANIGLAQYERPFYATPGQQFCFRTSDGQTAWMRVDDVRNNSDNADYIIVHVKVWPSGAP